MNAGTSEFIHVIPLIRFPWNAPFSFTYCLPPGWQTPVPGTVVRVPFRGKILPSVVTTFIHERTLVPARVIKQVHSLAPYLNFPPAYIYFCELAAQATLNHPARFIMPNLVRETKFIKSGISSPPASKTRRSRVDLLWWRRSEDKNHALINRAKIFAGHQHLILVPTLAHAHDLALRLRHAEAIEPMIASRSMTTRARRNVIAGLTAGKPCIIIGLRSALFLPFTDLAAITINDEEHTAYKQDAPPPHYHTHRAIVAARTAYHVDILYLSESPSMEIFLNHDKGTGKKQLLPAPHPLFARPPTFINLKSFNSAREPFDPFTLDAIKSAHTRHHSTLILIAKRGYAPVLTCRDCRYVFRCPTCLSLLSREDAREEQIVCNLCGYHETVPPLCPQCHGPRLAHLGFGEKRIEEYLHAHALTTSFGLPPHVTNTDPRCYLFPLFSTLPSLPPSPGLIVLQNADPLLTRASITASERAFHTFRMLQRIADEQAATLIIQTSAPDHPVFKHLDMPELFYRDELALRQQFRYPPFGRLISIMIPRETSMNKENPAMKLREKMKRYAVLVSEPSLQRRRRTFVYAFSLKFPRSKILKKSWENISDILKQTLPGNAFIDVDPERI